MLRKYLIWSQSFYQITPSLSPRVELPWHRPAPHTALSPQCSLPAVTSGPSGPPAHGTCPQSLRVCAGHEAAAEHLLTRQPFPERNRGATLSTAPSLSSPDHIYLHVLPTPQQKDGNLPTGQPANGPVLLHFLLTFFINLSTVRLI